MTGRTVPAEVLYAALAADVRRRRTGQIERHGVKDSVMLRWLTAGESHGPALVAILEGLPADVQVTTADIAEALARRRLGFGRGARMKFEADEVTHPRRGPARARPRAARSPSRSATPSGPSGRR